MTTDKPEVKRYSITTDKYCHPVPYESDIGRWVEYSSYKALQAECDALRAKTSLSLGVGDGNGNLFVHGDYDSIKRVQALIFECEELRKDAERYRWLRDGNNGEQGGEWVRSDERLPTE